MAANGQILLAADNQTGERPATDQRADAGQPSTGAGCAKWWPSL